MSEISKPSLQLLAKLSAIVVHADEYFSPYGHPLDLEALKGLLADPMVKEWIEEMTKAALAPRKRNP